MVAPGQSPGPLRAALVPTAARCFWERRLPPAYVPLDDYHGAVNPWMMDKLAQRLLVYENLETEKSHFDLELVPRSPRTEYGIKLTRLLLSRIETVATGHGADFASLRAR